MTMNLPEVPTEITTERLLLRMPMPGDGKTVNAAIQASLHDLKPWLGFAQEEPSPDDTEINQLESHLSFLKRESLRYLVFDKETGSFIGSTGFHAIKIPMTTAPIAPMPKAKPTVKPAIVPILLWTSS